ncbi:hypothetical protein K439DRAFT_1638494 [Ramaria rubella]|nr:hypothetical protein K439DRAFT_1638494 [Ramaria rubella]
MHFGFWLPFIFTRLPVALTLTPHKSLLLIMNQSIASFSVDPSLDPRHTYPCPPPSQMLTEHLRSDLPTVSTPHLTPFR